MNDKLIKCVWKHNHLPRHTLNWHIKQMSIWVPTVEGWWKVSSDYCLPLAFYYRANSASSFFLFFLLLLDAHWHPTRDDWRCWYRVSLTACSTSDITTGKKKTAKILVYSMHVRCQICFARLVYWLLLCCLCLEHLLCVVQTQTPIIVCYVWGLTHATIIVSCNKPFFNKQKRALCFILGRNYGILLIAIPSRDSVTCGGCGSCGRWRNVSYQTDKQGQIC